MKMNDVEKEILRKAIESNEGLISPATMINSYARGKRRPVENLVAMGYLEHVPEQINTGKLINFYRVTEFGLATSYPLPKKIWHLIKGDIKTIMVAIITSILINIVIKFFE